MLANRLARPLTKKLQVILKESEYLEIERMARSQHMSTDEWVRRALNLAAGREPRDTDEKLAAIRAAARHNYPTGDIDEMLDDIERGRGRGE